MRRIAHVCRRLVCWLKGHDPELHVLRKANLRGRAVTCRRCHTVIAFQRKPQPTMTVPKG